MVNITAWILAGAAVGWAGFSFLRFNAKRGLLISILIGMAGGFLGGYVIPPLLGSIPVNSGDLNPLSLFVAFASALACLTVTDMIGARSGA